MSRIQGLLEQGRIPISQPFRKSWDEYFIGLAREAATRSTCPRLSVGAVIVDQNHHLLSTGYNGSAPGAPHCIDVGCDMVDGSCKRTVHGEDNAIRRLTRWQRSGTTLYLTHPPCQNCAQLICNSGIIEVVYGDDYRGYGAKMKPFFIKNNVVFRQLHVATPEELM